MDKITGAINYEYQMLRYRHDTVSGEFVNIGIVFFDSDNGFLCARVTEKDERIRHFFGHVSGDFLVATTKHIENKFTAIAKRLATEKNIKYTSITEITASVLPINDNGLFFSDVCKGWHFDQQSAFNETYYRLVGKYNGETLQQASLKNNRNGILQSAKEHKTVLLLAD